MMPTLAPSARLGDQRFVAAFLEFDDVLPAFRAPGAVADVAGDGTPNADLPDNEPFAEASDPAVAFFDAVFVSGIDAVVTPFRTACGACDDREGTIGSIRLATG